MQYVLHPYPQLAQAALLGHCLGGQAVLHTLGFGVTIDDRSSLDVVALLLELKDTSAEALDAKASTCLLAGQCTTSAEIVRTFVVWFMVFSLFCSVRRYRLTARWIVFHILHGLVKPYNWSASNSKSAMLETIINQA